MQCHDTTPNRSITEENPSKSEFSLLGRKLTWILRQQAKVLNIAPLPPNPLHGLNNIHSRDEIFFTTKIKMLNKMQFENKLSGEVVYSNILFY